MSIRNLQVKCIYLMLPLLPWLLGAEAMAAGHPLANWHLRSPLPDSVDLRKVEYGNGRFVAGDINANCLVSTNGLDWTHHTLPASAPFSNLPTV